MVCSTIWICARIFRGGQLLVRVTLSGANKLWWCNTWHDHGAQEQEGHLTLVGNKGWNENNPKRHHEPVNERGSTLSSQNSTLQSLDKCPNEADTRMFHQASDEKPRKIFWRGGWNNHSWWNPNLRPHWRTQLLAHTISHNKHNKACPFGIHRWRPTSMSSCFKSKALFAPMWTTALGPALYWESGSTQWAAVRM